MFLFFIFLYFMFVLKTIFKLNKNIFLKTIFQKIKTKTYFDKLFLKMIFYFNFVKTF